MRDGKYLGVFVFCEIQLFQEGKLANRFQYQLPLGCGIVGRMQGFFDKHHRKQILSDPSDPHKPTNQLAWSHTGAVHASDNPKAVDVPVITNRQIALCRSQPTKI